MSIQKKFKAGDKVVWIDLKYWREFHEWQMDFEDILTVQGYEPDTLLLELSHPNGTTLGAFDYRFDLVESAQESIEKPAETPSNQGKTCSQNCAIYKGKETPTLEDKDENGWFKRNEFPPAGTVCEVRDRGEWLQTVVVGIDSEGCAVYESTWLDIPYDGENNPLRFRPIKTAEQIAAEEREKVIQKMVSCAGDRVSLRRICESLYDAGLRFVEKGE